MRGRARHPARKGKIVNVYIVMTDGYPPVPAVALLDRCEAEAVAASVYGLSQDGAAYRVRDVPVLGFAQMPAGDAEGGCVGRSAADAATD